MTAGYGAAAALALEAAKAALGEVPAPPPAAEGDGAALPPSRLSAPAREALAACAAVDERPDARLAAGAGEAYPDLVRRRRGDLRPVPDLVLRPGSSGALAALLAAASMHDVAIVPRGGGTTQVGGVDAVGGARHAAVAVLDLSGVARLLGLDPGARLASFEGGVTLAAADAALAGRGLELLHRPPAWARATLGAAVATRAIAPGETAPFEGRVRGVRLVGPAATLEAGRGPGRQEGLDAVGAALGSEGTLGVVEAVTVALRPRPAAAAGRALRFPALGAALAAAQRLAGLELRLDLVWARDEALDVRPGEGALLLVAASGASAEEARRRVGEAAAACAADDARDLGVEPVRAWLRERDGGLAQRRVLADAGYLSDGVVALVPWGTAAALRAAARDGVQSALGHRCLVSVALLRAGVDGAALGVDVVAPALPGEELERWRLVRHAVLAAVAEAGGSLAAVGTHHAGWHRRVRGAAAEGAARALRAWLDPRAIMNPGKLLAPD